MKLLQLGALLPCFLFLPGAHAVQDCELNGQSVNPANGNTTAGKTGLMRCKDRDSGLPTREQALQNGKFMGLVRHYQNGQLQKEYSTNERGNQHGLAREFAPGGQVLREATYDNGSQTGLSRSFYAGGQPRRLTFYALIDGSSREQAYAEFNESGQLQTLRCGDKPLLAPAADDARWCGFGGGGTSNLELFNSRGRLNARSSYLAGQRIRHETLNDKGQPNYQDEVVDATRTERYFNNAGVKRREVQLRLEGKASFTEREQDFSDSGSLTRDRRWSAGKPVSEQSFYLNGQPRSKAEYGGEGNAAWLQTTDYYDSGKVAGTGRYQLTGRSQRLPTGTHQRFNEAGQLVAESLYDDRGRITREKAWDADGKLQRDDAVFEDGSRKAYSK
jgi:antitoxin component YwqK of YwqJK toxin-antitoxin module